MTSIPGHPIIQRIDRCSKCGNDAAFNTPFIDAYAPLQEAPIICHRCSDDSPILLRGIEQHKRDGERLYTRQRHEFTKRGIVLWLGPRREKSRPSLVLDHVGPAWHSNGSTVIPNPSERAEEFLATIDPDSYHNTDLIKDFLDWLADFLLEATWCTSCGDAILHDQIAGRPLFAGLNCEKCWANHQAAVEEQRERGAVCSFCRRPYLLCCC